MLLRDLFNQNDLYESKQLNKSTRDAIPNAKTYKELDSYYDLYKLGVAVANPDVETEDGPVKDNPIAWPYTTADNEKLKKAEKKIGIKGKSVVSKNGSSELNTANITSPVAKSKKNRYGV